MIKLTDIRLPVGSGEIEIKHECARALGVEPDEVLEFALLRVSVDARRKTDVHLICSAVLSLENERDILGKAAEKNVFAFTPAQYRFPEPRRKSKERPLVVGMGPAGLFSALHLARAGIPPIILERGRRVSERTADVEHFWKTGSLSLSSNVQFGEGGAGTFSDGKLTSGISDSRVSRVFEVFTEHGAPREIMWSAKPHIGTDVLRDVVKSIRRELVSLGCDIRFEHKLHKLKIKNNALCGVEVMTESGSYDLECGTLILAPGHSARDTFEMLRDSGLAMEKKPFAIGVRIEHSQEAVQRAQFGSFAHALPAADYKLSCHLPGGRSAYSFCVCPGGLVVAASSEDGGVVTNGMSYSDRAGANINGGFLVGIGPEDFPGKDPLCGMRFQRLWEEKAFTLGGGGFAAPVQTVGGFLKNRAGGEFGAVVPSYSPGVRPADLRLCLPEYVCDTLTGALGVFCNKLRGFASPDALMTGVETRSSSPVRIKRGEDFQSSVRGVYPCGEGAGFAGGITSAAVDGIRVAEMIAATE